MSGEDGDSVKGIQVCVRVSRYASFFHVHVLVLPCEWSDRADTLPDADLIDPVDDLHSKSARRAQQLAHRLANDL